MIHFDLICDNDHNFEGWFANSDTFEKQCKAAALRCPQCGSVKISKAIMAPNIAVKGNSRKAPDQAAAGQARMRHFLRQMRQHIEQNAEHVGDQLPEVARKIHYGEREAANIYGDATAQQVKELSEEGIEIAAIPWIEPEN